MSHKPVACWHTAEVQAIDMAFTKLCRSRSIATALLCLLAVSQVKLLDSRYTVIQTSCAAFSDCLKPSDWQNLLLYGSYVDASRQVPAKFTEVWKELVG